MTNLELYDPKKFGDYIKRYRESQGMSRAFLSEYMEFSSETSVMNIENGASNVKLSFLAKFCGLFESLTLPIFLAMYEADSLRQPCRCVCHHDMNKAIPGVYLTNPDIPELHLCRLCGHNDYDCEIINGLWFERPDKAAEIPHL